MNIVEIAGHLGADPETRVTPNGIKITTLRIAASSRKAGKEETIWWRATIFGDRFEKMLPHFKKGSAIIVMGELNKPEIWMDKEGRPQITLEVIAEIVKFSPFGRGDKPAESGAGHSHAGNNQSNSSYSPSGYSNAPSHQEPSYGEPYNQPQQQAYGSGYSAKASNDDEIPF